MGRFLILAGALAAGVATAAPTAAQYRPSGHVVEITPYAGYMLPTDIAAGPLGTRIGLSAGPVYGGQLALALAPGLAVVGHVGFATADLQAGAPLLGGVGFGSSEAWIYDGALQLSLPAGGGAVRPFLHLGAGGIRRELSSGPVTVRSTSPAVHGAVGLDVALVPGVSLRLLARDHVGKFDFREAVFLDVDGRTMHNVTLAAGLKLAF